jgi:hypothetical protein
VLPNRETRIELFGSKLQINKRLEAGYWRAFRLARRSPVLWNEAGPLLTLALILQPGDTFVDVGANVRLFSSALVRLRQIQPSVRFRGRNRPVDAGRIKAVYLDDYAKPAVPRFLTERGFTLFDGRSLLKGSSASLLAFRSDQIGSA